MATVLHWGGDSGFDPDDMLFDFLHTVSILMLQDAIWLWDRLPLLQYVEFPWRLLGPAAVCVALMVAALGPFLASLERWRTAAFTAALALLIVPNLAHNQPKQ